MTALAACKLVDILRVVRSGLAGIPNDNLPIPIGEPDTRRSHRLGRHEEPPSPLQFYMENHENPCSR
jgi:hypothetical protein